MVYRLSNIDIRHLRIFKAVVECRGFTSARAVLNISQPTISNHISELEGRLGIRLCDRGRSGFRLTAKGERVFEEVVQLFKAHEQFETTTQELKGNLRGFLNIGLIDNVVTDPNCPIIRALELLDRKGNQVTIRLDIMMPSALESALLQNSMDIAVGTFDRQLPDLDYRRIYVEENELFCSCEHSIADLTQPDEIRDAVRRARKVTRVYLEGRDLFPLGTDDGSAHGQVHILEAAAILILSGTHIGFLPRHYAKNWVTSGRMRSIMSNEYRCSSDFYIVTRRNPRKSTILNTFLADLDISVSETVAATKHELSRMLTPG